ncbi:hypothetical protein HMPREF0574_0716 [Mobiluncus curtisii subsp. curtisii ATCC 35241]|nr:hypothetical protein HMPREF0574_0716 [Mobiluncus curtisii subsp. curtisii ATCC 35241]
MKRSPECIEKPRRFNDCGTFWWRRKQFYSEPIWSLRDLELIPSGCCGDGVGYLNTACGMGARDHRKTSWV